MQSWVVSMMMASHKISDTFALHENSVRNERCNLRMLVREACGNGTGWIVVVMLLCHECNIVFFCILLYMFSSYKTILQNRRELSQGYCEHFSPNGRKMQGVGVTADNWLDLCLNDNCIMKLFVAAKDKTKSPDILLNVLVQIFVFNIKKIPLPLFDLCKFLLPAQLSVEFSLQNHCCVAHQTLIFLPELWEVKKQGNKCISPIVFCQILSLPCLFKIIILVGPVFGRFGLSRFPPQSNCWIRWTQFFQ